MMAKYFEGTPYQYDPEEVIFKLNREYFDMEVNPQMIQTAYGALLEGKSANGGGCWLTSTRIHAVYSW